MSDLEKDNRPSENKDGAEKENNGYRFMDQTIKERPVSRRTVLIRVLGFLGAGVVIGLVASFVFSLTQPAVSTSADAGKVTISSEQTQAEETPEAAETSEAAESPEAAETPEPAEISESAGTPEPAEISEPSETPEPAEIPKPSETSEPAAVSEAAEIPETAETLEGTENPEAAETPEAAGTPETAQTPEETVQTEEPEAAKAGTEEEPAETAGTSQNITEETVPVSEGDPETAAAVEKGITLQEYRQLYKDMMDVAEEPEHALVQVIGITKELDYFNQNYENQRRISGLVVAMTDTALYILTEYRVVERVQRIQVVFCDGTMTDAVFQKADQNTGLAVLKIWLDNISEDTKEKLITAPLGNSYKVERGEPVLALGSPLGFADSIAYGIVTSTSSKAPVADAEYSLLTTDIDGSPDGSGVLIDLDGKVVGVITGSFGSSTGSITCLAISQLKELIEDLSNNEPQNYIGILGQDVTQDITDRTGIPRGLLVTDVIQDSPAMLAGIKKYDVVVKIEDQMIDTMHSYHKAVKKLESEETVVITAMRKGTEGYAEMEFEVTVESR